MKTKNIEELCKTEAGSFKKFVHTKEAHLQALENDRKERIRTSQKAPKELSMAA